LGYAHRIFFPFYWKKNSLQKKAGKENFWGIITVFFSFGSVPDIG